MLYLFTKEIKWQQRIGVSAFFFLAGFTFASWASRIPDIQASLHLNEAELGAALLTLPIGLMVCLTVAGALITRFGSQKILLFACLLYALVLMLLGQATSPFQLGIALFGFGFAGNLFNISVNTQAVAAEKAFSKPILASFHGVWSLAGFTGAAFGSLMISLQLLPASHFLISGMLGIAVALLCYRYTISHPKNATPQPAFVMPDKSILQYGIIAFCCLLCEGTMFDWSGVYFKKVVEAPIKYQALGYSAFMGCMAAGRFMADHLVTRFGTKRILQFSGICMSAGIYLAVLFPELITATIGFMLVGFGVCSVVPIVYSLSGQSKTMNPGQAIAAVSTVGFAGFLVGPPLIGFIAQASSLQWSFALVGLVGLGTALFASMIKK